MIWTKVEHFYRHLPSPVGRLLLISDDKSLCALLWEWADDEREMLPGRLSKTVAHPVLDLATAQLEAYFRGDLREFSIPLRPSGTSFQLAVWQELRKIPYGETINYGEQARRLGAVNKARAVGAANGKNPISIIVPCHRVIGKNGSLTGFGGGIENKALLLELEKSRVPARATAGVTPLLPHCHV